ncbi:MAG: O-antigen ligase family protein [Pseudomonadota bacterium]
MGNIAIAGTTADGRRRAKIPRTGIRRPSTPHASNAIAASDARIDPRLRLVGLAFMWVVVFSSFFVIYEPAPYEFLSLAAIVTAFMFGMTVPRPAIPMIILLVVYVAGGFIGVFIAPDFSEALFQISVTLFLALTTLLFACYLHHDTLTRMQLVISALQIGAIFAVAAGVIGYFNIAGTAELFTLYDRARGTFQDPNVFGPYVTGAAVFAIYSVLSRPVAQWGWPLFVLAVCALGILLSFSRGAWGYTAYAAGVVTVLHFSLTNDVKEKLRIIFLAVAGLMLMTVGFVIAISIPAIAELFEVRANLIQNYDGGELGRFGRIFRGFAFSIEYPLGLGAFGFKEIFGIDPHNVYLNALLTHGWAGFFAYTTLVFLTAYQLLRVVLFCPPLRSVAVPVFALFTGLMLVGTFIDTDRWRQFFMLLGISWGIISASLAETYRLDRPQRAETSSVKRSHKQLRSPRATDMHISSERSAAR